MKKISIRRSGRTIGARAQKGFGMAIALAVLAVFALIAGAIALANKGGSTKADLETAKIMSTSIINRGNELLGVAQRVGQDRDIKLVLLDASAPVPATGVFGLYATAINIATDVQIPGRAMTSGNATSFALDKTTYTVVGIGPAGATNAAMSAVLTGVTLQTCQLINKTVQGLSVDAAVPTVTTGLLFSEGCYSNAGVYSYFKALGSAI